LNETRRIFDTERGDSAHYRYLSTLTRPTFLIYYGPDNYGVTLARSSLTSTYDYPHTVLVHSQKRITRSLINVAQVSATSYCTVPTDGGFECVVNLTDSASFVGPVDGDIAILLATTRLSKSGTGYDE
jgi:hypothetical protein